MKRWGYLVLVLALGVGSGGCLWPGSLRPSVARAVEKKAARQVPGSGAAVRDTLREPAAPVVAPAALVLDLTNALWLAFEHSREIQNRRDRVYAAGLATLAARRQFGFQYAGTVDYVLTTGPDRADEAKGAAAVTVSRRLPTGATLEARAGEDWSDLRTGTNAGAYVASAAVELRQPLLAGAGYAASHEAVIQAEQDLLYDLRALVLDRQDIAIDIVDGFYRLLIQKAVVDNVRSNTEQSTYLRRRSEALFKIRRAPAVDVMRSQQSELAARNRLSGAETDFSIALKRYLVTLGLSVGSALEVTGTVPDTKDVELDEAGCVALAMERRLDLQTARDRVADAQRRYRAARLGLLPNVEAYGKAESGGTAESASPELDEDVYSVGVTAEIPLDRRPEREAVMAADLQLSAATRELRQAEDSIRVTISASFSRLMNLRQSASIEAQNVALASRRVDYALLRFRNGELSNRDVVEAQDELLNAQNALIRSRVDYEVQRLRLFRDTGLMDVGTGGEIVELERPAGMGTEEGKGGR